jgi:hypothetical protein
MNRAFPLPQAVLLAVLFHAFVFVVFAPALRKGPAPHKIDLVFWGSILRAQDLMPGAHEAAGISDVRVISPAGNIRSTEVKAWKTGSAVEKPTYPHAVASSSMELAPQKFVTERVELNEPSAEEPVLGLPKAENVPLKESRP